ncbi:hypothetical protein BDP27DRAFT_1425563 [Rhodocollybia butyracea]|uniref:Uncharacterized protein n=1 Tax=Rhodocollybia butyracea TaxID=206335 RepID=A0A9P5PK62_9AGAR|nr:hypothetical protein BDP27DRAFT_1425563 [Rhodocollybia butyracea]
MQDIALTLRVQKRAAKHDVHAGGGCGGMLPLWTKLLTNAGFAPDEVGTSQRLVVVQTAVTNLAHLEMDVIKSPALSPLPDKLVMLPAPIPRLRRRMHMAIAWEPLRMKDDEGSQSGRQSENDGRGSSQPITPLAPLALPKIGAGLGLGSLGFGFSYLEFSDSASFTLTSSPANKATGEATADQTAVISSNLNPFNSNATCGSVIRDWPSCLTNASFSSISSRSSLPPLSPSPSPLVIPLKDSPLTAATRNATASAFVPGSGLFRGCLSLGHDA